MRKIVPLLLPIFVVNILKCVAITPSLLSEQQQCPEEVLLDCESLQVGQYYCSDPQIDPDTQSEVGCSEFKRFVEVDCYPVQGICCNGHFFNGSVAGFKQKVPCHWTNGKSLSVALLLSIFLGWLGIDRFYLGYPALGLLKLSTFGCMLIWTLIDIILIAIQIVRPVDGSNYIVDYYGPTLVRIMSDNMTYMVPADT